MSSEAGTDSVERPNGYTYQPSRIYGDGPAAIEVGVERVTGRRYLRTAMLHRNGEFDEYRGIDISRRPERGVDVHDGPTAKRRPVVVDGLSLGSR